MPGDRAHDIGCFHAGDIFRIWTGLGDALQRTGLTADDAAWVLGGNMIRVAARVWG